MKYLLCLAAVAFCEGARIRRGLEETLFPNFRSVYHGHGAISYQNVQIDSHGAVPIASNYVDKLSDLKDRYEYKSSRLLPIVERREHLELIGIPHEDEEVVNRHGDLEHDVSQYYQRYYHQGIDELDYEQL